MMNHQFYQQQNQLLTRRATEPVTLAPTASMIDPNLESHRIQHPNLTTGYGQIQMQIQGNVPIQHPQNSGPSANFDPTQGSSTERSLPSRQVDENSIDDAYAQYILYCNPTIPLDVDTTELKKGFRAPPKSDAKTFSPFTLYTLVSQLENKEIKTWTELVLKLGVEPPDATKNQSTQKVQQYAVRLKVDSPFLCCQSYYSTLVIGILFTCTDLHPNSDGFMRFTLVPSSIICKTSQARILPIAP